MVKLSNILVQSHVCRKKRRVAKPSNKRWRTVKQLPLRRFRCGFWLAFPALACFVGRGGRQIKCFVVKKMLDKFVCSRCNMGERRLNNRTCSSSVMLDENVWLLLRMRNKSNSFENDLLYFQNGPVPYKSWLHLDISREHPNLKYISNSCSLFLFTIRTDNVDWLDTSFRLL